MSSHEHTSTAHDNADPKWAAVVGDRLTPMPRRRLRARDVLHQAGANGSAVLIRDLNSPVDIGFAPDAIVDLAEGNVFRIGHGCSVDEFGAPGTAPKLAFVIDDAWEVTIAERQTLDSLRGLFDLDNDVALLRDLESPHDQPIGHGEPVLFRDGPVFRTRERPAGIRVSTRVLENPVPAQRFRVARTAPLLQVMQVGAERANIVLLPNREHPLDKLRNVRGQEVGPPITDLDETIEQFLRQPGTTRDFAIELVLAIRVNAQWRVATAASLTPRQILVLFDLDPAEYSLYRGQSIDPLPPDTAITLHRGDGFEAQRDGKYGESE